MVDGIADELRTHLYRAAGRAEVRNAVAGVYAALRTEVNLRRPVCVASGRCCRFEEYGHRLFVTTMELAAFVYELNLGPADAGGLSDPSAALRDWDGTGCPFQVAALCGVHALRPFGCRMFFCDASSTQWQNEQYERFHGQLKRLHDTLGVPYFYVEWRQALRGVLA